MNPTSPLIQTSVFGLLQVQGPDAVKFLQGQVTCDVAQTSVTQGLYGAHCNPKGRILFSFFLFRRAEDCLWLQIPCSLLQQALKDLQKYSVFSKVTLTDISENYPLQLIQTRQPIDRDMPFNTQLSLYQDTTGFIRQRSPNIWEVGGSPDPSHLPQDCTQVNHIGALVDIQQGIAHIFPESRELFTPEEINFPLIDAVSFRKGCYTGQEIIARMHYKGKHKRHAYRFVVETGEIPLPGSSISSTTTGQKIGELISAASIDSNQIECLASITDDNKHLAQLDINKEKMLWLSLPYAIPVAEDNNAN